VTTTRRRPAPLARARGGDFDEERRFDEALRVGIVRGGRGVGGVGEEKFRMSADARAEISSRWRETA
jgi:hypothetical protein